MGDLGVLQGLGKSDHARNVREAIMSTNAKAFPCQAVSAQMTTQMLSDFKMCESPLRQTLKRARRASSLLTSGL
eukprot:3440148-Prymnesium_polylepis.3